MLPFPFQLQDGLPVSDQIVLAVRKAIIGGLVADGDPFPSVRVIAQELKISPTTAHKVVLQLKDEGLLGSRPGVGMVVTSAKLPSIQERQLALRSAALALLAEAEALQLPLDDTLEAVRMAHLSRKK